MEENKNWKYGDNAKDISISKEIQFFLMNPDEAKNWYSQNALDGDWDDFMYYDGYFNDCRMVERYDYRFEVKDYMASDGTFIRFSNRSSMVSSEDITDKGERTVDFLYSRISVAENNI